MKNEDTNEHYNKDLLKLSSVLDVTVTNAVYDSTDSSRQAIKLTFSSPVLPQQRLAG
jgi:hypothetical protein